MRKTWVKRDNIYYKPFYKQKLKLTLIGVIAMGILFFVYQLVYISQLLPQESMPAGPKTRPHKADSNDNPITLVELAGRKDADHHGERANHRKPNHEQGSSSTVRAEPNGGKSSAWNNTQFAYIEKIGNYERKILRGIRLLDLDHYSEKPGTVKFRCLSSHKEIPWEWVNDDYCDCPEDGSDEPSTSACPQGRFYCRYQKRHKTGRGKDVFVSSGRVNDGVCDCCDGSDEWLTTRIGSGRPACPNVCKTNYVL
ncbi:uncharacterized protein LOC118504845 isoform X1 [Anopheles stephensi]|uniref:uncharacterized protein LOC118504845 isoform X1 n=1 Tax=Anopheles stephensi TaxID=30069 RepID=UPI001658BF17|nr:uncharacterized protein LOC118504845 isoform X1 [Anopheles stephensi]